MLQPMRAIDEAFYIAKRVIWQAELPGDVFFNYGKAIYPILPPVQAPPPPPQPRRRAIGDRVNELGA